MAKKFYIWTKVSKSVSTNKWQRIAYVKVQNMLQVSVCRWEWFMTKAPDPAEFCSCAAFMASRAGALVLITRFLRLLPGSLLSADCQPCLLRYRFSLG